MHLPSREIVGPIRSLFTKTVDEAIRHWALNRQVEGSIPSASTIDLSFNQSLPQRKPRAERNLLRAHAQATR